MEDIRDCTIILQRYRPCGNISDRHELKSFYLHLLILYEFEKSSKEYGKHEEEGVVVMGSFKFVQHLRLNKKTAPVKTALSFGEQWSVSSFLNNSFTFKGEMAWRLQEWR